MLCIHSSRDGSRCGGQFSETYEVMVRNQRHLCSSRNGSRGGSKFSKTGQKLEMSVLCIAAEMVLDVEVSFPRIKLWSELETSV